MKQTATIKCPVCETNQSEEIYDLTMDLKHLAGTLDHICENCDHEFTVKYDYKPYVITY